LPITVMPLRTNLPYNNSFPAPILVGLLLLTVPFS